MQEERREAALLIYEYKLDANKKQIQAIEEAIKVCQFIRNRCIRLWMNEQAVSSNYLQVYCSTLASEYDVAKCLNSQDRQAVAD